MTIPDGLLACPACNAPLERPGACDGASVRMVDGWYVDAVEAGDLFPAHRDRIGPYDRQLTPRLYDVDVRLSSETVWGAPVARQVEFNRGAVERAAALGLPYLDLPVGTGLLLARALRGTCSPPRRMPVGNWRGSSPPAATSSPPRGRRRAARSPPAS